MNSRVAARTNRVNPRPTNTTRLSMMPTRSLRLLFGGTIATSATKATTLSTVAMITLRRNRARIAQWPVPGMMTEQTVAALQARYPRRRALGAVSAEDDSGSLGASA